jgi:hypothetical protein
MTPEQALESARDYLSQQSQRRHQRQWLAEMLVGAAGRMASHHTRCQPSSLATGALSAFSVSANRA